MPARWRARCSRSRTSTVGKWDHRIGRRNFARNFSSCAVTIRCRCCRRRRAALWTVPRSTGDSNGMSARPSTTCSWRIMPLTCNDWRRNTECNFLSRHTTTAPALTRPMPAVRTCRWANSGWVAAACTTARRWPRPVTSMESQSPAPRRSRPYRLRPSGSIILTRSKRPAMPPSAKGLTGSSSASSPINFGWTAPRA